MTYLLITGAALAATLLASPHAQAAPFSLPLPTRWEDTIEVGADETVHGEIVSPLVEFDPVAAARAGAEAPAVNGAIADGLIFPLRQSPGTRAYSQFGFGFYVDNNPGFPNQVRDYAGQAWTYDLDDGYNHAGSDFLLAPFHWYQMDNEAPQVVAALGGVVEAVDARHYDRNCAWTTSLPPVNGVRILHDDGSYAIYLHMRQNSLNHLSEGQRVAQGDYLGQVASSGFSLLPHLHFELRDAELNILDPFAGPGSQSDGHWRHQPAYLQTDVVRVSTHSAPPVRYDNTCLQSVTNLRETFAPGQRIYATVSIRHQPMHQLTPTIIAYTPDGTEIYRETAPLAQNPNRPQLATHTISADLPPNAPSGTWRLRVEYNGRVYHGHFNVGSVAATNAPVSAILPSSRSVRSGQPATAFLTAINSSNEDARACQIRPGSPFDGRFSFHRTDPDTNAFIGNPDFAVDIPAGGRASFLIAATPAFGSTAEAYDLPVIVQCANSPASVEIVGVNTLRLSFSNIASPDLIAIAATTGNNGILDIAAPDSVAAFAVSTANVGASGSLTLRPLATGGPTLDLTLCETEPASGACIGDRSASLTRDFIASETASFAVFARAGAAIPFQPGRTRVQLEAVDSNGVSRGATSVAVRTLSAN
jgi:murein DD-endopeptidase MepM/ murein hydrolase activator NlpD